MSGTKDTPVRRPVVTKRLRTWLAAVFLLFALLAVNSVYLGGMTIAEAATGRILQDYYYLLMFIVHLALGLVLVPVFLVFAIAHMRRAWRRPNRNAVRAGLGLFATGIALLVSGILLTRFDFLTINHPTTRSVIYWMHVVTPFVAAWLFVLHRLAGPGLRWRVAARWVMVAGAFAATMVAVHVLTRDTPGGPDGQDWLPALARVEGGGTIPARNLMTDDFCAECHEDIADQAAFGMHRFSSFNNPVYRFSVEESRAVLQKRDGGVEVARLCAVCHDQVPLFSGRFDDPAYDPDEDPGSSAGITCVGCHAIVAVNSPRGNGAYTLKDPPRYPFASSANPVLAWLNRQLIKAKPGYHSKTLLKPLHETPEFCSVCHKVALPWELNHYRWLRGQDHYGSFLSSGVSGHRVDSFYYPEQAAPNCAHCHMPLVASDDPAARRLAGKADPVVHNHLFAAANTAVPELLGLPAAGNAARRGMLEGAARVDIFGVKDGGSIEGELLAPVRPAVPVLQPGRQYLLETVVRTLTVGHLLTQGTSDSNELWLDVTVRSGDRVIGRSGATAADGDVDPWSYFLNTYMLDRDGNRIERRNAQDIFVALYNHQIPPGAASVVHYALAVPEDVTGPVEVEVKLQYRKFDTRLMRHVQGDAFAGNRLPVVTLASDRVVFPVAEGGDVEPQQSRVPPWQRWNDYGIGLLREGDSGSTKGELRQAEAAFTKVERLGRPDGPLNLARVYFKEGRLEDTVAALQRAEGAGGYPWVLAWYAALVDREYGRLDAAIERVEALVETRFESARQRGFDFASDIRVLNLLGRTLFEKARQTRGEARREERNDLLNAARSRLEQALQIDPEDVNAHHNLALVTEQLGDPAAAARHREAHERYRVDDLAVSTAVARHRSLNAAADHAAQPIAIYDLGRTDISGGRL